MDILYSKTLETSKKNEYISDIEYESKRRVDHGADENTEFANPELKKGVLDELKRRALVEIRYVLESSHSRKKHSSVLRKHKLDGTSLDGILKNASKKTYKQLKAFLNDINSEA